MIATKLGANIIGNVIPIATASTSLYKAPNENMLGRKLQIKFNVKGKTEWFKGTVNSYQWRRKHGCSGCWSTPTENVLRNK